MITQAMILAAGKGTRMGSITAARPKPLLEIGGVPLLQHILTGLAGLGISHAVVVIGHLGEQLERHFGDPSTGSGSPRAKSRGDGGAVGLRITYCRQERQTGTAQAALLARRHLDLAPIVMSFGDILCAHSNYRKLLESFTAQPCDALLGLNPVDDPWAGAAVYRDGDRVTRIIEKPPRGSSSTRWNNAGVMVLTPAVWPVLEELPPSERGEYELPQGIARMVGMGCDVRGVEFTGFWSDVGTPEVLERLKRLAREDALDLS